eukprot:2600543-Pleurochrysis_carterae.AAC.4
MPSAAAVNHKGKAFVASVPSGRVSESCGATGKQCSSVSRWSSRDEVRWRGVAVGDGDRGGTCAGVSHHRHHV